MIRFSLITVTFRAGHTFRRTAESVASQTHPWVEHIIIDGGSPDGTLTAISEKQAAESTPARIYDLNGRQLTSEPQKGIYVKNGKKIAR